MKFEHTIPTINQTENISPVQVECVSGEREPAKFKVIIPDGYKYPVLPKKEKVEKGDILPMPEFVKQFPELNELLFLNKDDLPFDSDGGIFFNLNFTSNPDSNFWESTLILPKAINNIIAEALMYETSINPQISDSLCYIDIRVQKYRNRYWPNTSSSQPHFDGSPTNNSKISFYTLSSPPSTVVYGGEYDPEIKERNADASLLNGEFKMTASSMLPWQLIHSNYAVLHSQPWGMLDDTENIHSRFFIRVTFEPKRK